MKYLSGDYHRSVNILARDLPAKTLSTDDMIYEQVFPAFFYYKREITRFDEGFVTWFVYGRGTDVRFYVRGIQYQGHPSARFLATINYIRRAVFYPQLQFLSLDF